MKENAKHLIEVSKKIHEIRKIMGYATKDQREEGWSGELRSVKYCVDDARKDGKWIETGGFRYTLLKNGNVRISPAFNWIIKKGKTSVSHRTDKKKLIKNGGRKRHKK